MFAELRAILLEVLKLPSIDITPETTTFEAGLDSLDIVELSAAIRQRTGIRVTPQELTAMERLGDIAGMMEQRAGARAR